MTVEIMFKDLRPEKQKELLELFGVESPDDMNWEVIPVTIIEATPDTT